MRKSVCFCLLICMLSVLIGCGGSVPKESTIAVDKKGKITDTIVAVSYTHLDVYKRQASDRGGAYPGEGSALPE